MNLLLTNDDGFDSVGIKVLANRLSKEHNVFIVAPSSNRSAVSHCITMFQKLNKCSNLLFCIYQLLFLKYFLKEL